MSGKLYYMQIFLLSFSRELEQQCITLARADGVCSFALYELWLTVRVEEVALDPTDWWVAGCIMQ